MILRGLSLGIWLLRSGGGVLFLLYIQQTVHSEVVRALAAKVSIYLPILLGLVVSGYSSKSLAGEPIALRILAIESALIQLPVMIAVTALKIIPIWLAPLLFLCSLLGGYAMLSANVRLARVNAVSSEMLGLAAAILPWVTAAAVFWAQGALDGRIDLNFGGELPYPIVIVMFLGSLILAYRKVGRFVFVISEIVHANLDRIIISFVMPVDRALSTAWAIRIAGVFSSIFAKRTRDRLMLIQRSGSEAISPYSYSRVPLIAAWALLPTIVGFEMLLPWEKTVHSATYILSLIVLFWCANDILYRIDAPYFERKVDLVLLNSFKGKYYIFSSGAIMAVLFAHNLWMDREGYIPEVRISLVYASCSLAVYFLLQRRFR